MKSDPEKIGDYRVLRRVGQGGMAEVFAVEKTGPGGFQKKLCLKRIRRDYAKNAEFIQSFESEARLVARLEHPNIVQVFDFFRHEDDLCLVMELVDGMDLNGILKVVSTLGVQLPVTVAVYILESLLHALEYSHHLDVDGQEVCVIHRDISPQNLLVSNIGIVKLADFGVAKAQGMTPETTGRSIKGKLSYLAPERLKSGATPIGPESDLFSAGIVFWEMLATRRLFKATMEHQVLSKVMHFEKAPIDYLPAEMNQYIEKLLAPNPNERFRSADEALIALKAVGVQSCTQAEIVRLVREMNDVKRLKDEQEAREKEDSGTVKVVSAIPLVNKCSSCDASDEPAAFPGDAGPPEISAWKGGSNRKATVFVYAIVAGVVLVAIALGIRALWRDYSEAVSSQEAAHTKDAVMSPKSSGDFETVKPQNYGNVEVGLRNDTTGPIARSPRDSAVHDTSAAQENDSAPANSQVIPGKTRSPNSSVGKYRTDGLEPNSHNGSGLNLLPFNRNKKGSR